MKPGLVRKPGIYGMPAAVYHGDPCPRPSLSRSVAQVMLERTPKHAWEAHPRLNPNYEPAASTTAMNLGTVVHALLLGDQMDGIRVVKSENYRSFAAQRARDMAEAAKLTPILQPDWEKAQAMAKAARPQLEAHEDGRLAFTKGKPEQTLIWKERIAARHLIWCRARFDWLPDDPKAPLFDFKTTGKSAEPYDFGRMLFSEDYDLQAGFYRRGALALRGELPAGFFFVCQEDQPPFALSVNGMSPRAIELADAMADTAITLWAECQKEKCWPGYPAKTAYHDPPAWKEQRWGDRIVHRSRQAGISLKDRMLVWQAPFERRKSA